jgi:hypothetical protein
MNARPMPDYAAIFDEAQRAASEQSQPGPLLRCFSDIAPKPLRWLWPSRIPLGKLTLLIGDPGLGKSLLTADIASRVTRGRPFPDGATCESGSVIFLSAEDDAADTIRPRLDAAGADVSRVHTLEAVRVQLTDGSLTEKAFNLETDCAALEVALRKHPDVRLIVIDPISAYLGGVDSHSNAEVRGVLARLATLAAQHGVAVLCITHLRKSAGAAVSCHRVNRLHRSLACCLGRRSGPGRCGPETAARGEAKPERKHGRAGFPHRGANLCAPPCVGAGRRGLGRG